MPSRLRLSTPARSETSSPLAASISGMASRSVEAMKMASVSSISAPPLELVDQDDRAGDGDDDQALDDQRQRRRHARHDLHGDAARAQEAEEQRARQHAERRAARQQADHQAVEAVARGEAGLEVVLLALQHDGAGQPAEGAGDGQRHHQQDAARHAGAARRQLVQPDGAQAQAEGRALQHDRRGDRQQRGRSPGRYAAAIRHCRSGRAAWSESGIGSDSGSVDEMVCGWRSSAVDCTHQ